MRNTLNMPSSSITSAVVHQDRMQTLGNQIGYKARNMTMLGQPTIDISLHADRNHQSKFVMSYSSMDTIDGTVTITAQHDTRFEDIDISFTGMRASHF